MSLLTPVSRSTPFRSAFVSMRNAKRLIFNVLFGANAGNAPILRMQQAKDVAGIDSKQLRINDRDAYQNLTSGTGQDTDDWAVSTVTNAGLATAQITAAAQTWYKIDIRNDQLDANNNFDCAAIEVANLNGATVLACWVEAEGIAFKGDPTDQDVVPSMAINSQSTL